MRNATKIFFRHPKGSLRSHTIWLGWMMFLMGCFLGVSLPVIAQDKQTEPEGDSITIEATLVTIPVIVTDAQGKYIQQLKAEDFKIFDNNTAQQINFFDAADAPLHMALLIDTSYSTSGVLKEIKEAGITFLRQLRPKDKAMVLSFDSEVRVLTELTDDPILMERAVAKAEIGKKYGTRLHDALAEAIQNQFKSIVGRKAIVLLTDGKDLKSKLNEKAVFSIASETSTMIYTIFFMTESVVVPPDASKTEPDAKAEPSRPRKVGEKQSKEEQVRTLLTDIKARREWMEQKNASARKFLDELATTTGGRSFTSEVADLKQVFRLIADELRTQYTLGFYPSEDTPTSDRHVLKVEVARPDVVIRARRNYRP